MIENINKTKSWFCEKIKLTKPLARFIKEKSVKAQIRKIRDTKGEIKTVNTDTQRIKTDD